MTNLIIDSFQEEAAAIEASHKLSELESIGDITIYERVVVKKNTDGKTVVLQADTTEEGGTTLSGMAIGTLVGSLAGPVGMLLGMFTGTLTGAAIETDEYGFAEDFLSKVSDQLQPGMAAVIAEIEEDKAIFVDETLSPLGGTLTRADVDYEYTKYSDEEVDEVDEDIAAARAKLKAAADEDKNKFRQKIGRLKEKRKEKIAELKEKAKEAVTEVRTSAKDRKIDKMRSKIEKHQAKIADLEKKLQAVLEKAKEEVKEPAS
ncbi:MAG TPA: DUF1269 domain-containing protein [Puia sp.]|jgi:uncharacterized membrane protein|nr:DUF1269 domain-containing protein [Puia sp.]